MSLANLLITTPLRETAGSIAQQRFNYQAQWALTLIFDRHAAMQDYAIVLEFHDDVVLLDSPTSPSAVSFFQVKTKKNGQWTLAQLFRRSPSKSGSTEPLPSTVGKLVSNIHAFSGYTQSSNFVSNVPCSFLDQNMDDQKFIDCGGKKADDFSNKVKTEVPEPRR
jgi:hypothetical protein